MRVLPARRQTGSPGSVDYQSARVPNASAQLAINWLQGDPKLVPVPVLVVEQPLVGARIHYYPRANDRVGKRFSFQPSLENCSSSKIPPVVINDG